MTPGGIPDEEDFSTLAGELLHHGRFPAGIGLSGQDYQEGIGAPQGRLKPGSPAASARGLEVSEILYLITPGNDSSEKRDQLRRFKTIAVDRIHQYHAFPHLPRGTVDKAAWIGWGPLNLIEGYLSLGWRLVAAPVKEQQSPDKKCQGEDRDQTDHS